MSCFLCCFKTLSSCGLRDLLVKAIAFHPPKAQKYQLKQADLQNTKSTPLYSLIVSDTSGNSSSRESIRGIDCIVLWLQTKTNTKIPAAFFQNKSNTSNYVILYSHGNATDLGLMKPHLLELSAALNVHVFAYEYRGYGPTKGTPNDVEVLFDAIAAYDELTQRMGFKWSQIILYGRSIGTGPSLYLASHPNYPVTGVILHSPLASGLRMFDINMKTTHKMDLFPNSDLIQHVKAPVFIMHGEADKDVPIAHGKLLANNCKNLYQPWWAPEGTHNDLDIKFRRTYLLKLSKYIKHIKDINIRKTNSELEELYKPKAWHHLSDHIYFKIEKSIEENWKKLKRETRLSKDSYLVGINSSFMNGQSIWKGNTGESMFTTLGDQTIRKNVLDSARSALESEAGKESHDCASTKLASCDISPLKGQSIEIDFYPRFNAFGEKQLAHENPETPRIIEVVEQKPKEHVIKEKKEDNSSPHELSFENSQFATEHKSSNIEGTHSKHDLDSKKDQQTE